MQFKQVVKATLAVCKSRSLGDFKIEVTLIPTKLKEEHKLFMKDSKEIILEAKEANDVFVHFNTYWNYLNYNLLEYLVEEYGSHEIKEMMSKFVQELDHFMEITTMADFMLYYRKKAIPSHFKSMITHHKLDSCQTMLLTVMNFRKSFCDHLSLHQFSTIIEGFEEGSVKIVWHISSHVVEHICANLRNPKGIDMILKQYSVMEILINGEVKFSVSSAKDDEYKVRRQCLILAIPKVQPSYRYMKRS